MTVVDPDPDLIEQERIDKKGLSIKFKHDKNIKSLFDILFVCFYQNYNVPSTTIDVETLSTQCTAGRRRSLEDIYLVSKYYIPSIQYKKIRLISEILQKENKIYYGWCSTVYKWVHRAFGFTTPDPFKEYLLKKGIEDDLISEEILSRRIERVFNPIDHMEAFYNRYGGLKFENNIEVNSFSDVIWYALVARKLTIGEITGKIQCDANRKRHLRDIYRIAKYYFPSITFARIEASINIFVEDGLFYSYNDYGKKWCSVNNRKIARERFNQFFDDENLNLFKEKEELVRA